MALRTSRGGPIQSLTVGNIVSVALEIYRLRWKEQFFISLLAHLWIILITFGAVLLIAIALGIGAFSRDRTTLILLGGFSFALALPALLFGLGRFLAAGGLLARQIFNLIREIDEPLEESRRKIYPRLWAYLLSATWIGLFGLGVYLGFGLLIFVLFIGLVPIFNVLNAATLAAPVTAALVISGFLLGLGIILLFLLVIYYVTARLFLADVVLALEENVTALESVRRSWKITRGNGWRTLSVLFIATLGMIPATLLATTINLFVPVVSLIFNIALFPFWQAVKAVLYYDLRARNEGMNFDVEAAPASPRRFLRQVRLQTPESVELDFVLGGLGSRVYAWIIDGVLILIGLAVFFLVGGYIYAFALLPGITTTFNADVDTVNLWALAIALVLYFLITNGYFIAFETRWQGQTPGKRLAKIRVVRDNGQPIGLREATLRSLLGVVDVNLFYIGFLLVALSRTEKRLGDMAAGTLVIQDQQGAAQSPSSPTPKVSDATKAAAQTLLSEANIRNLTPDQYITLRDFLKTRQQLEPAARSQTATKLATQVQTIVFAENQNFSLGITDEEFLEAAYLAYRQTSRSSRPTTIEE